MRSLVILFYLLPVAVLWIIWAGFTFWVGVPDWFSELVKYSCIAATTLAVVFISITGGSR